MEAHGFHKNNVICINLFPSFFLNFLYLSLSQCLLDSMSCQGIICKWNLTVCELYKCNNISQLLFNLESSILDTTAHNGQFRLNYPLLLPKSTIKLSIKAGRERKKKKKAQAGWVLRHQRLCQTHSLQLILSVTTILGGILIMYCAYAALIGWVS